MLYIEWVNLILFCTVVVLISHDVLLCLCCAYENKYLLVRLVLSSHQFNTHRFSMYLSQRQAEDVWHFGWKSDNKVDQMICWHKSICLQVLPLTGERPSYDSIDQNWKDPIDRTVSSSKGNAQTLSESVLCHISLYVVLWSDMCCTMCSCVTRLTDDIVGRLLGW